MRLDVSDWNSGHLTPAAWDGRAAVVIPVISESADSRFLDTETDRILFEVRGKGIDQAGDICFPGGHAKTDEPPEETAVRETKEELLLNGSGSSLEIAAPLDIVPGPKGILVASYLGFLTGYDGAFQKEEIARVFSLPVRWFLDHPPVISELKLRTVVPEDFPYDRIPNGRALRWRDIPRPVYFYDTPEGLIWGLTAELIYRFLGRLEEES